MDRSFFNAILTHSSENGSNPSPFFTGSQHLLSSSDDRGSHSQRKLRSVFLISLIRALTSDLYTWPENHLVFSHSHRGKVSLHPRGNLFAWESHPFLTFEESSAHPSTLPTYVPLSITFSSYHCLLSWFFQTFKDFSLLKKKKTSLDLITFKNFYWSIICMYKIARKPTAHWKLTNRSHLWSKNRRLLRKIPLQLSFYYSPYFYCQASWTVVHLDFHYLLI